MVEAAGARLTRYFSSHNHALVCKRPDGAKYRKAREWGRPVANAQWLSDLLLGQHHPPPPPDLPKYQQFSLGNPFRIEVALVPQLMAAWKAPINITQEAFERARASLPPPPPPPGAGNVVLSHMSFSYIEDTVVVYIHNTRLLCTEKKMESVVRLPHTRMDVTVVQCVYVKIAILMGEMPQAIELEAVGINDLLYWTVSQPVKARQLGCALAARKRDATHFVMPQLNRTIKLLCALSVCQYVVSEQWILDSHAQNTLLDEQPYILDDPEFEKTYKFNVTNILKKPSRNELFKGRVFYLTPSVVPSPRSLTEIIECAGGIVERRHRPPKNLQDTARSGSQHIVITAEDDLHLLTDLGDYQVYNGEWVMHCIMHQEILYENKEETTPSR
ncbi:uncharacterized protein GBIM_17528 [Gryllus bimaculatus]|nr:uncharacterized protein GBIM_17528 [Gryllus bimaculatus]